MHVFFVSFFLLKIHNVYPLKKKKKKKKKKQLSYTLNTCTRCHDALSLLFQSTNSRICFAPDMSRTLARGFRFYLCVVFSGTSRHVADRKFPRGYANIFCKVYNESRYLRTLFNKRAVLWCEYTRFSNRRFVYRKFSKMRRNA